MDYTTIQARIEPGSYHKRGGVIDKDAVIMMGPLLILEQVLEEQP